MSTFELKNELASVSISEHVSEIHSFRRSDCSFEYMWQGDPAFWSQRNPTLFPMVGSTWDKKIHLGGKEYEMGNHGFARHADFTCIEHTDAKAVMKLSDSEETLKQYPFHFTLTNTYELNQASLTITSEVTNENEQMMPFNFGYHPAFNCPLEGEWDDWCIELNQPEEFSSGDFHMHGGLDIPLDRALLAKTIIIPYPKSTEFTLTDGRHGVKVHAEKFEWVAFWSPNAPFVCIEPWHSHTDFTKVRVPFERREGTIRLKPHETWRTSMSISVF